MISASRDSFPNELVLFSKNESKSAWSSPIKLTHSIPTIQIILFSDFSCDQQVLKCFEKKIEIYNSFRSASNKSNVSLAERSNLIETELRDEQSNSK